MLPPSPCSGRRQATEDQRLLAAPNAGTRIGSYEVVAPLGSGGMGDVYRARDIKLNREVVIQTLSDLFASDPDRLARFEREAQMLAALNARRHDEALGARIPPTSSVGLHPTIALHRAAGLDCTVLRVTRSRRGEMLFLALSAIAAIMAQTPAGGAQACDGTRRITHTHAVCGVDNFWHIVSDDYYACRDGKERVYRTHDEKTVQRCVDPQPVPPPILGRVIKCDDPAGDVEVPACINNSWHRLTYQRFKCDDGTLVTSGPPKRTEMVRPPQDCSTWSSSQPIPPGVLTTPPPPSRPAPATPAKTAAIGLVLPRDARPGERVSGSVTRTPATFASIPALRVVEFEVALTSGPQPVPNFDGVRLEIAGRTIPAAEGPVEIQVPQNAETLRVIVHSPAVPAVNESLPLNISAPATAAVQPAPAAYEMPPVAERVNVIRGPFDGSAATTAITIETGASAEIVAETPRAAYYSIARATTAGAHQLTLREGAVSAAFPLVAIALDLSADQLSLLRGQSTRFRAVIRGLERAPDRLWRGGFAADLVDLARVQGMSARFTPPRAQDPGFVFFAIENRSEGTITISANGRSGAGNEVLLRSLGQRDFVDKPFTHEGRIKSKQSGGFRIDSLVVPCFAPVTGRPVGPLLAETGDRR